MQAVLQYGTMRMRVNTNLSMEEITRRYKEHVRREDNKYAHLEAIPVIECECPVRKVGV